MTDMLVRLYDLPDPSPLVSALAGQGIVIRPARAFDRSPVVDWVAARFSRSWADECRASFTNHPVSCFIAVKAAGVAGFACYDATCRNFFGPTGVAEAYRGQGIGKALALSCLHAMAAQGFAYAVIGGIGPGDYYAKTLGAVPIQGSSPGIYQAPLKG